MSIPSWRSAPYRGGMNPRAAKAHGDQAQSDPGNNALTGDSKRAPADANRVCDAADLVNEDDRIGGLRSDVAPAVPMAMPTSASG